ncbi:cytochrome c3 family protein [Aromatoleum petrolei]|uniref:Doubled CXXCH motif domain-containing protein n=1 Tax=Aromatoleum petrolei TaxID=76116 RepID=A0ABX1MQQ3_9RHOO|nr:cytochrome c3 family protein [Aromatoleum petrolei]NMF88439.1 hypothetical protein [Aromatoleum petrolei]QTQ36986.1 Doubled CXXCH motif domain-containing protein [Aromatoleum petrolei]
MKNFHRFHALMLVAAALLGYGAQVPAQNTNAKISNTKHNLSANGPGTVKSAATSSGGTDQICVFCHTPHAANATAPGPLWNRTLSTATYTPYTSNSLDAEDILNGTIGQPGGASKLCLSCHDGTLALGAVANSPGSGTGTGKSISMVGTPDGKMPTTDNTTGYTRNLGVDLRNDHPISFTFQSAPPESDTLSRRDGEFRSPPYSVQVAGETKTVVGIRSRGTKPMLPLDHEGKVQCTSCHDPHLDASKFLRLNRFQTGGSPGTNFNPSSDQICLGCHDKNKDRQGNAFLAWSNSAHANTSVATYSYLGTASTQREFPAGIKVWEAGCLNCHDTHTVQGSRRILREGTDSSATPKAGGNPAIEETCYQCHTTAAANILSVPTMTASTGVPNIRSDFTTTGNKRMPIASGDQPANAEKHDIGGNFSDSFVSCNTPTNKCGADFIEDPTLLGSGNHLNRHVECTDCHNPHRVLKNALFNGKGSASQRTHVPGSNIASGPLRGTWGVEPTAGVVSTATSFPETPSTYTVKRGEPGGSEDTARTNPYLTREYQLCLKCHSDYGAGTTFPSLGSFTGGTATNTNGMSKYTNVAAEFSAVKATDPPTTGTDQGEKTNSGTACGGGDCNPSGTSPIGGGTGNNHRSWHPVMWPTGRDAKERTRNSSGTFTNIRNPFSTGLGTQTMYCSDCHGNSGSWSQGTTQGATGNGPNLAQVQGPHGSPQNFILKGKWDDSVTPSNTRDGNSSGGICGRCHHPSTASGFAGADSEASHGWDAKTSRYCMACHIAVPHGWKNKAFLVNLACVGPEGGKAAGCTQVGSTSTETIAPYYYRALLRINTWQASGQWTEGSCGVSGNNGKDWMSSACGF